MSFTPEQTNPLSQFMRQPKIYIRLPSQGQYWPQGSLEVNDTNEYPVYSMTAKDELLLNVPDALMNGQAVVDVIQSCMPNIKNAWDTPSIDIDLILIAIRLATYGEKLTTPVTVNNDIEFEYQIDLRTVIDELIANVNWDPVISINDELTIFVRPLPYKEVTKTNIATFETQKLIEVANNSELSDDDKLKYFKESLDRLTSVTIGSLKSSVIKVDSSNGSTSNPQHIEEFINNIDKEIYKKIQDHIDKLKEKNTLKPLKVEVTDDMRAQGVEGEFIDIPLQFDPSTFFA